MPQWVLRWIDLCDSDEHRTTPRRRCAGGANSDEMRGGIWGLRTEQNRNGLIFQKSFLYKEKKKSKTKKAVDCIFWADWSWSLGWSTGLHGPQGGMGLGCWRHNRNLGGSVRFFYQKIFGFFDQRRRRNGGRERLGLGDWQEHCKEVTCKIEILEVFEVEREREWRTNLGEQLGWWISSLRNRFRFPSSSFTNSYYSEKLWIYFSKINTNTLVFAAGWSQENKGRASWRRHCSKRQTPLRGFSTFLHFYTRI